MVKINKFLVTLFSIMAILVFLSQVTWSEERVADANEIVNMYFYISKSLGSINSYVIFVDANGKQCAAKGSLTLNKKWIEYVKKSEFEGYRIVEKNVPETRTEHLKNIDFESDDFKNMSLRNGDIIYALPIELSPNEVNKGDIVILEWRDFKVEKEVYELP